MAHGKDVGSVVLIEPYWNVNEGTTSDHSGVSYSKVKILTETDLYDTDMEVQNLIDWVCVSEQIKSNNNEIR